MVARLAPKILKRGLWQIITEMTGALTLGRRPRALALTEHKE